MGIVEKNIKLGRSSNFELLRIIAMAMIVYSHFFIHANIVITISSLSDINLRVLLEHFFRWGEIGVTCFVLVSGYFLIDKKFSIEKLTKYVLQLWMTGVAILIFTYFSGVSEITNKYFWGSITPFYSLNWFAKAYLYLYLFFPIINKILHSISKKIFLSYLLVFGFLWYVVPFVYFYEHGNNKISILYIYTLGAYIKMYGINILDSLKNSIFLVASNMLIILFSIAGFLYLSLENQYFFEKTTCLLNLNSITVLLSGLGIFMLFKNINIGSISIINKIAKTSFGVYLIHDNPMIKDWLWNDVVASYKYFDNYGVFPYALISVLAIYAVCGGIDYLRITYLEEYIIQFTNRHTNIEAFKARKGING